MLVFKSQVHTSPDRSKCSIIRLLQKFLKTSKLQCFCGSCVVRRNSMYKHLFTCFFLECIDHLLQKIWWKFKFGNPILVFGSAWLEKAAQTIFFKSYITIPFYMSFRMKQSFNTEKLVKVRIWQVNFRSRKWFSQ